MATAQLAESGAVDQSVAGARFRRGGWLLLTLCCLGLSIGLALLLLVDEAALRAYLRGTFKTVVMYRGQDTIWFGLCVSFGVYLCWSLRRGPDAGDPPWAAAIWPTAPNLPRLAVTIALLVLIVVGAGTYLVHHGHATVLDESQPALQAEIFLSGRLLAPAPEEWEAMTEALFPFLMFHDPEHHLWGSAYRPVHAAIRAAFDLISLGTLSNAILTVLSVLLIVAVARRIWPDRADAVALAAIFLATGPQFLFTGMTGFPWSAHLFMNLLWLWLYLRDDRWGHGLAALVGFFAVGLHQVNVHPLFVMPFMLSLLWARRWWLAAFYAGLYSVALLTWSNWNEIAIFLSASTSTAPVDALSHSARHFGHPLSLFGLPVLVKQPLMVFNLLRLLAWQNIMIVPLIFVALRPWSSAPQVVRLLAWGCVLTMIPYVLIMPNQSYAWGYRYAHGLLGSLALIAAHGWVVLSAADRPTVAVAKRAIIGFTALVLAVGLPLRAVQMDSYVRPLADAHRFIRSLPTDVVLVDIRKIWFQYDAFRNDPFLADGPIVLSLMHLSPDQVRQVCGAYSVTVVDGDDLAPLGVKTVDRGEWPARHDPDLLRALADGPACQNR